MIKSIPKPKKKKNQTVGYWSKKADKAMQELGRCIYEECMICGGEYSCLHHFFPKSTSTFLRYNLKNLVPICAGCHHRHHNANDPRIHQAVIKMRGQEWYDELESIMNTNIGINAGYTYYREKYNKIITIGLDK